MPIPVACQCGAKFAAGDHLAGQRVACPKCKQPLAIPAAASGTAAQPAQAQPAQAQPAQAQPATASRPAATAAPSASPAASSSTATAAPAAQQPIAVACQCGAKFAAPPHLAGRKVACPKCKQPLSVPAAGGNSQGSGASGREASASPASPALPSGDAASIGSLLDEVGVKQKKVGAGYCPSCGGEIMADALLCVHCGLDLKKGRKLKTETVLKVPVKQDTGVPLHVKQGKKGGGSASSRPQAPLEERVDYYGAKALMATMILSVVAVGLSAALGNPLPTFILGILVYGVSLVMSTAGGIWLLVIAFRESTTQGLLCMFVPFYLLIFVITRWESTRTPFMLQVKAFFMLVLMAVAIFLSAMLIAMVSDIFSGGSTAQA